MKIRSRLHTMRRRLAPAPGRWRWLAAFAAVAALAGASAVWAENSDDEKPDDATAQATGEFRNPINGAADPTIVHHDGNYYLSTTQGDRLSVWKSPSLAGLLTAPRQDVWIESDPSRNQQMWAPALHQFDSPEGPRWYLYYTASDGVDENHRMYVLESEGDDPAGPYQFKARIADHGEYAIDGEPFMLNGKPYFVWTGPGRGMGGPSQLYIQEMSDPWTTVGDRVAIPADGGCPEVREGPTPLYGDGQTFLTYSTCDTGKPDYQLWMKSIADGANPMDPASWVQHAGPAFARDDAAGVWGPGHHFFFKSPDGTEDWIAYHGKNTGEYTYSFRTTRAQKIGWNDDGTPALGTPLAAGATQALPSGDPGPGTRAINDFDVGGDDFQVEYAGTWNSGSGCGVQCYQGDDHWSQEAGATATFTFTGTQIALFSVRDVGNGYATFSIDGGDESEPVDFYSDIRVGEQPNYVSPVLEPGTHTLRVTVTGEKNSSASAAFVSVDRAEVYGG
ncbi:MAG: glycoside hydrolase family 43 protein [Stackebrandtia sp.]